MIVAIDGASRRNGKPDCLASGGVFIMQGVTCKVAAAYKKHATNQQGELLGLIAGLRTVLNNSQFADPFLYLVTDSEYVYNAISKDWIGNWQRKGWLTAENKPVKSQDLWQEVTELLQQCDDAGFEVMPYHIKGHLMSVGAVTAKNLLHQDTTGALLYSVLEEKYEDTMLAKPELFENAFELFKRNHGYEPPAHTFKEFVLCNSVADYVAGTYCDKVDAEWIR